ncbi:uncharacterized protein LOC117327356 [Pecten maximus]|uniref:uncharacterized protein LOC117327356 n=1 Tax=Pecten maximus TaxID=6579 RepID=UPI001458A40B|nr:uncharacterized protein LOC117327356 [Pecten maximus]
MESEFINSLEPRMIIDILYEQEVITQDEHLNLNDIDIQQNDRRCQLLELIATRGEKAFTKFKQAIAKISELSALSNELEVVDYCDFKQTYSSKPELTNLSKKRKEPASRSSQKWRKKCRKEHESEVYKTKRKQLKKLLKSDMVPRPVSSERKQIKYVESAFDKLADMYNNGQSREFALECVSLKEERPQCYDTLFTVAYMQVLFAQLKLDYTGEKTYLAEAKSLMPKTKDPMYSQLLVLSPQTRKYLLQRKFEKLQKLIDDRKMIVQSNPWHCTGRGAAWVYYNEGRAKSLQLDMITGDAETSCVWIMRERIMESYNRSLEHFNEEMGQDRIYGAAAVKFQLVVLLLRCGCNGHGMCRKINLSKKDATTADFIMEQYEGSNTISCPILEMYFRIANCDRMFRKNLKRDALKNAERALVLARDNMTEFVQPIQNRIDYLRLHTRQFERPLIPATDVSTESPY